ncbi:glycosyltransferase [Marinitoga litoralis]|uniref:glycosyltransferase n=1 Tax=Marinitoga litoralis TaxID=570855 RepID=UPI00196217DE|nr:glycosyltransferase [Marinitoga litoralis]MBM7560333.1 glycosyltransferase involved in cell wall biosynthesis [Marinitoga litoralis]
MDKPIIFLFTSKFPYDKGEEFLENEVPILSKYFNVIIVPRVIKGNMRVIPNDVKVDTFFSKYQNYNKIFLYGITKIHGVLKEFIDIKKLVSYKSLSYFGWEKVFQKWFKQYTNLKSPVIFYSYWFSSFAYALTGLKKHVNNRNIVISRAHGSDLYEFIHKNNYLPLRKEILKNIDRVFCVSENGKGYLSEKYSQYRNKIEVSRLGVMPQEKINIGSKDEIFRIITCSYLKPVKRIHLIIEALYHLSKKIKRKIIWNHIGNGPLEEDLKKQARKLDNTNIDYYFMGYLENNKVKEYYNENPVDLFLNVSESEGLPVSIMEALSFGIPVIATDVGGTGELIDDKVGKLIPSNITSEELADYIYKFINLPQNEIEEKRKNALKRWDEKVNAEKNYKDFSKRILKLLEEKNNERK